MRKRFTPATVLSLLLLSSPMLASDLINDGEEADPGVPISKTGSAAIPSTPPQSSPALISSEKPQLAKILSDDDAELKPFAGALIGESSASTSGKSVFSRGDGPSLIDDLPSTASFSPAAIATIEEPEIKKDPVPIVVEVRSAAMLDDLTADLPGEEARKRRGPFYVPMEDYQPDGLITPQVRNAYELIAQLKTHVYQLSDDLDAGGKEKTRLIQTSQVLGQSVQKLHEIWPNDQSFRDRCISAKRAALVLEEELAMEPRKWTHVRWAFGAAQREIVQLRKDAVARASLEPKPMRMVVNGKEVLVIPSEVEFESRRQKEVKRVEASNKAVEDLKKERGLLDRKKQDESLDY